MPEQDVFVVGDRPTGMSAALLWAKDGDLRGESFQSRYVVLAPGPDSALASHSGLALTGGVGEADLRGRTSRDGAYAGGWFIRGAQNSGRDVRRRRRRDRARHPQQGKRQSLPRLPHEAEAGP